MSIAWRDVGRHFLLVVAFCCVIAVLTTGIWPGHGYAAQLGHALCIGLVTWLTIEFGRYAVDERHCHPSLEGGHGWPRGWRALLLTAIGIAAGFTLGEALGRRLFLGADLRSARDDQLGLLITIAAGAVASFFFHARGRAAALAAELARGLAWGIAGLRYDWDEYEALFAKKGLPPQVPAGAWRSGVPVYDRTGRQVGQATSGAWSPMLKANLALASVRAPCFAPGTRLQIEVTVEFERHRVGAVVEKTPFYNPERKRSP